MSFASQSLRLLSASSQYASITDAAQTGLDITGDLTLEAWVNPASIGSELNIVSKYFTSDNNRSYRLFIHTDGKLGATLSSSGTSGSSVTTFGNTALQVNRWYHVAVVYTAASGSVTFYINGVSDGTTGSVPTSLHSGTAPVQVGRQTSAGYMDGLVKDVRIWSSARTSSQIADNMLVVLTGSESNLKACWLLEGDYLDLTSNNNDLTASGSPTFVTDVPFSGVNDSDWTTSKRIYIPSSKVSGSSDLTNFPVLIKDSAIPSDIYASLQSGGGDLRLSSDSAGVNELPFEIVSIDTGNETAEVWAKLPTLHHDQDTELYLWAGNASAAAYSKGAYFGQWNVWGNNANLVAHGQVVTEDSSVNQKTLTNNGSITTTTGKIGSAPNLDYGSTNSTKSLSRSTNDIRTGTGNFTNSILFKTAKTGADQRLITYGTGSNNQAVYLYIDSATNKLASTLYGRTADFSTNTVTDDVWHLVHQVYDGTNLKLYVDGQYITQAAATPNIGSGGFRIGRDWSATNLFFSGVLDEIRVLSEARSADWIATEYTMMNDPEAFIESVTITTTAIEKALSYAVRTEHSLTKDLEYSLLRELSKTSPLKYAVLRTIEAITKGMAYRIAPHTIAILAMEYAILRSLGVTKSMAYQIALAREVTKQLAYTVLTDTTLSLDMHYLIMFRSSVTKSLAYFVASQTIIQKSMGYHIGRDGYIYRYNRKNTEYDYVYTDRNTEYTDIY